MCIYYAVIVMFSLHFLLLSFVELVLILLQSFGESIGRFAA
jgi:hypothetical protein